MARVRVEFYGVARLRAGRAEVSVTAASVRDALVAVERDTGLRLICSEPQYLVSINATRFTSDLEELLAEGDGLLILGADAGG